MRSFAYWYVQNIFTKDELKNIVAHAESNFDSNLADQPAENVTKTAKVKVLNWGKSKHLFKKAVESAKYINLSEIGYDIYDVNDYMGFNYNVYDSNNYGQYDWHIDSSPDESPTDVKLTLLINVSIDSYEGGGFQFFRQGIVNVPELDVPGSIIVFPSFFNHRVLPVTQGTRRSIAIWIHGPKFR